MKGPEVMNQMKYIFAVFLWVLILCSPFDVYAAPVPTTNSEIQINSRKIELSRGESQVFRFVNKLKRISVAQPKVVEALAASPQDMVLNGKESGSTTVIVWDETGKLFSYEVTVGGTAAMVARVRDRLEKVLPKEKLSVESAGEGLIISGIAGSEVAKKVALKVGEAFAPKNVVDNIRIEELPPQVILKVHFAEIIKSGAIQLGWGYIRHRRNNQNHIGFFPGSPGFAPSGPFLPPASGLAGPDITFSDVISFFFGTSNRSSGFFLRALKKNGYVRTLAEPHLRVVSGKKAKFLAGGEVPIPTPSSDGSISIVFKPFGVELEFKAVVKSTGYIDLEITPSVSALDNTIAVVVSGTAVPGLKKSKTTTQLQMRDGQTIAISGLINEEVTKNLDSIPFLGDIPILGPLFQSKDFREKKTELVVLVTPQVIRPRRNAELTLTKTGFMVGRTPVTKDRKNNR
jgi:pilus assembly protein CpaC